MTSNTVAEWFQVTTTCFESGLKLTAKACFSLGNLSFGSFSFGLAVPALSGTWNNSLLPSSFQRRTPSVAAVAMNLPFGLQATQSEPA